MRPASVILCLLLIPALLAASDQFADDVVCGIVLAPALAVYYSVYGIHWLVTLPHPLSGKWESLRGLPDGSTESLEFRGWPLSTLERRTVRTRQGRFRVDQRKLILTYASPPTGAADEEVFSILVRRAATVLRDQTGQYLFKQAGPGDASQPILGRWIGPFIPSQFSLDLHSEGTFEVQETHRETESFKTTQQELKVQVREGGIAREEPWHWRTANGHLFLTHDGNTVEYQHPRK